MGLYSNLEGDWLWGFGGDSKSDRYELWRID